MNHDSHPLSLLSPFIDTIYRTDCRNNSRLTVNTTRPCAYGAKVKCHRSSSRGLIATSTDFLLFEVKYHPGIVPEPSYPGLLQIDSR